MSESLEDSIIRHEGFIALPKIDVAPNYVIGYGHDIPPDAVKHYSNGITMQEAIDLLKDDIENCKDIAGRIFPWMLGLDDIRKNVIYEMIFQLGASGVQHFPKMIAAIRDKDYNTAAKEMLNSEWHSQTPDRCAELANLMRTGGIEND